MKFEITRIWNVFFRYRRKFYFLWIVTLIFTIVFYFLSPPQYKSDATILMKNDRKPWQGFKQGDLPKRDKYQPSDEEQSQAISLRDPFWNFLYDQIEKTTYDFTPFFFARTTVFRVMDDTGSRSQFDNGSMSDDEIVAAFTENLNVEFDKSGSYIISYRFPDPILARTIVNRYTELFTDFIKSLDKEYNLRPSEAVRKIIGKLKAEIYDIDMRQAKLKAQTGIIAPAQYFTTLTDYLYTIELRLAKAEGTAKAAYELIPQTEENIRKMSGGITEENKSGMPSPASEILADPLLVVIVSRIFWDAYNLAQAEMIYVSNTPQIAFWKKRLESSENLLYFRFAEDESGRKAELYAIYVSETAKAAELRQRKNDIESALDKLPEGEREYVLLHREKAAKGAALSQMQDLAQTGESYLQKGDKIAAVLDAAYIPKRKVEPVFWKMLFLVMFSSTLCGFGWFFIRENIEIHGQDQNL